ncbi:hypothetical protein BHE74_00055488, partial [Ensete ventricosum]
VRERADIEYGCKSTFGSLWVATGDSWSAAGGSVNRWNRRFISLWGVRLVDLRRARDCWIKPTIGNSVSHSKCTDPMLLQTSSACNGLGITGYGYFQVAFARRALIKPELRMAHNLHTLSSLLGGALFVADDFFPATPYIHAAWHLAAAVGVGTCNKLLE